LDNILLKNRYTRDNCIVLSTLYNRYIIKSERLSLFLLISSAVTYSTVFVDKIVG